MAHPIFSPKIVPKFSEEPTTSPPVAAVLSWPMGPSDAPEHLWAQIHVRAGGRVYETRAIYFRDQWWLTIWDWEDDPPVWMP